MPSNLRVCENCRCKVAPQYFSNSSTCRMCVFKNRQVENANQINDLKEKYNSLKEENKDLKEKYEALLEFVSTNVGAIPPSLGQTPPSGSVPPQNGSSASQESPRPASQDDGFQRVKRGAKPPRKVPEVTLPITSNRFQVLAETMEDEFETRLVGDSMIKGQLVEFCGRSANGRRKCYAYRGGTLDDMTTVSDTVTDKADSNTVVIIHAGTNDVQSSRSEELLAKYERMIKRYKEKVSEKNIMISGILPRAKGSQRFFNIAFSANNRLKSLCERENVNFVNFWDNFYFDRHLFWKDGLHLNECGSARFGRLLCNELSALRAKNGPSAPPPAPS